MLTLYVMWRVEGAERTYHEQVKRLAFATRYGHASDWVFRVPTDFLQDYCQALASIVEEENRPRR